MIQLQSQTPCHKTWVLRMACLQVLRGWWWLYIVKCWPYRYRWNFCSVHDHLLFCLSVPYRLVLLSRKQLPTGIQHLVFYLIVFTRGGILPKSFVMHKSARWIPVPGRVTSGYSVVRPLSITVTSSAIASSSVTQATTVCWWSCLLILTSILSNFIVHLLTLVNTSYWICLSLPMVVLLGRVDMVSLHLSRTYLDHVVNISNSSSILCGALHAKVNSFSWVSSNSKTFCPTLESSLSKSSAILSLILHMNHC